MKEGRKLSPYREYFLNFSSFSQYRNAIFGVAALWIVLFHGVSLTNIDNQIDEKYFLISQTLHMGNVAVDMFIVLSGMGLYYSFSKKPRLGDFYVKRLVRVYVPYLLMTLPYILYYFLNKEIAVEKQIDLPLMIKAILTVNFWTGESSPIDFWYVSLILVLYLLYPLIFLFLFRPVKGKMSQGKAEFIRFLILTLFTIGVAVLIAYCFKDAYAILSRALSRITAFVIGCYIGKLVKEKKKFSIIFLILSVAIFVGAYYMYVGETAILKGIWARYYGSLTGIALVFIFSQLFIPLSYFKLDKILGFFGKFSLEIYIMSIIGRKIYYISGYYMTDHAVRWYLIYMAGAILAAYLVSLIEIPISKLLLRYQTKRYQPQRLH